MEDIEIREANLEDKEAILNFLRENYPRDYIFHVLDSWLRDERGRVLIALHKGRVVAMNHFYVQDKKSAWLEGARVDKEYRNMGIATKLAFESLNRLKQKGVSKARLVTAIDNIPAQRHLSKTPFKLLSKWLYVNSNFNFTKFKLHRYDGIENSILNSEEVKRFGGIYHNDWAWFDFEKSWLYEKIEHGEVYATKDEFFIISESYRRKNVYSICFLQSKEGNLFKNLDIAFSLAKSKGCEEFIAVIPSKEEYKEVLSKSQDRKIEFRELLVYQAEL